MTYEAVSSLKKNKIQTQDPDTLTNQQWLWFASEKRAQLFMSFLSSHGQGTLLCRGGLHPT